MEDTFLDFESFSTNAIADEIFQALSFYISTTGYLKKRSSRFINITDLELTAKSVVVDNPGQIVTDFEREVLKKKNKCAAKKKERLVKFPAFVEFFLSPSSESSPFLLPYFMPTPILALVPALIPTPVPALVPTFVSRLGLPAILLSCCIPIPAVSTAFSLPQHALVSCCEILVFLSLLLMLDLSLFLGSSTFKTFKQSLSDKY